MPNSLHFVNVIPGKLGADGKTARKALRSHVMKNYRYRQRLELVQRHTDIVLIPSGAPAQVIRTSVEREQPANRIARNTDHEICHIGSESPRDGLGSHENTSADERSPIYDPVTSDSSTISTDKVLGAEAQLRVQSHQVTVVTNYELTLLLPQLLQYPSVFRKALLNAFIKDFFPSRDWSCSVLETGFDQWLNTSSPAMEHSNDSIGLLSLGDTTKDKRLTTEGQRRQVLALQSLRSELCKPGVSLQVAFLSALTLCISGLFSATSSGLTGCISHIGGLTALLQAHIEEPNAPALTPVVKKHYHLPLLMDALMNRKALSVSRRIIDIHGDTAPGSVEALMQLATHLTGLLGAISLRSEKSTKRFHKTNAAPLRVTGFSLARDFDKWLQTYEEAAFRYRRAPLKFGSFLDANILGLYWSCRLLLAKSQYQLHETFPGICEHDTDASQRYRDEADIYATYLFETALAVQIYEGSNLSKAFAARAPLHFAVQWWKKSGDEMRLRSVLEFESRLRLNMPSIDWDTLLYWSFFPILWLV